VIEAYDSYLVVNLDNIVHNFNLFRKTIDPNTKVMAVVKADAYGHGAREVSDVLRSRTDWFGVTYIDEAVELREEGIENPILIFSRIPEDRLGDVVEYSLTPTIFSRESLEEVVNFSSNMRKKIRVHIEVDTGMGRLGVLYLEAIQFIEDVLRKPWIEVEGVFSHLATSYIREERYTTIQIGRFTGLLRELERRGIWIPLKHISNTGAILNAKLQAQLDLVRIGIGLYGLSPSPDILDGFDLRPSMEFRTRVISIKDLPPGFGVSYGKTYITQEKTRVAVLPVGYSNGYCFQLSGKAEVLVRGERVPVLGRVCMDFIIVDVTKVEGVKVGDEVVIFGAQGGKEVSIDEVSNWAQTINYEVVTRISKRLPVFYIREGVWYQKG
jgi:alanine racemase